MENRDIYLKSLFKLDSFHPLCAYFIIVGVVLNCLVPVCIMGHGALVPCPLLSFFV